MKLKRKSPVAKTLVKNGCAALMAAIEIHNKPVFDYRYEVCTLLVINAWELVVKALIYQKWKNIKLEDEGNPRPFKKCLNDVAAHLTGEDARSFLVVKENLENLYKYRNSVAHFHSEELDVILFSLLRASVIDFAAFVRTHFNREVCGGPTVILPIHVSGDFNPIEFLVKRPSESGASNEVHDFINGLFESCERLQAAGINDSIFSTWTMGILSAKKAANADVLAARTNTAPDATPINLLNTLGDEIKISDSPSATLVRMTDEEFFKIYSENYEAVCNTASEMFDDFKANSRFHAIKEKLKGNPNFHEIRWLGPEGKGQKKDWYTKAIYGELAKHYTRES